MDATTDWLNDAVRHVAAGNRDGAQLAVYFAACARGVKDAWRLAPERYQVGFRQIEEGR